ncbi:thermonuclease family protein [[Mycoplasma] gypis]|uniref:Thermonuclease family protein n=1 Tax=[Mycoplasma] gypis TaxID=92404 RepID=A0ABZ2RVE1_9BACT|nr:thermonuclease family protein [[Mycoplasma] gypis]MBN0919031.1 thermonuclease family protein [[Mycoplasma] gypis]
MLKNKKRILFSLLAVSAISTTAFVSLATSCQNSEYKEFLDKQKEQILNFDPAHVTQKLNQTFTFEKKLTPTSLRKTRVTESYWDLFKHYEGEVVNVFDGDTYTLKIKVPNPNKPNEFSTQKVKVRSWGIDTPETESDKVQRVSQKEQSFSDRDTEFAKSLLTPHRKVILIADLNVKSYDRVIGITLFSDKENPESLSDYNHIFEIEMLYNGFTVSRINSTDVSTGKYENPQIKENPDEPAETFQQLFLWDFAYAWNNAILNRKNFYNNYRYPYQLQDEVYGSHGDVITSDVLLPELTRYPKQTTAENNIFKFLKQQLDEKKKDKN